ncbi:MAG: EscU/YscU/HrcU family type III secretion system export apparatus switch protein [Gammaproteobacteria bacterium]|nr:EscU/YscU/HrcU family type III secretion system export apparatus switch protein [Gammaproteobacteria bacterium]
MSEEEKIPGKPSSAVALRYDGDSAPRVIAKGEGHIAEKIIEIAEEHGIVLYQDSELVKLLSKLDLNEEIPNNLYHAVAAVLAFVYRINGEAGKHAGDPQIKNASPLEKQNSHEKDA